MRAPVLVHYDIAGGQGGNMRRALMVTGLDLIAVRVQQSAWLVPAEVGWTAEALFASLQGLLVPSDRLHVQQPCRRCQAGVRAAPEPLDPALLRPSTVQLSW